MIADIRSASSDARAYLVIATYGALFTCGLASYALSLQLFRFLHATVKPRLVAPTFVCVGIGVFATVAVGDKVLARARRLL